MTQDNEYELIDSYEAPEEDSGYELIESYQDPIKDSGYEVVAKQPEVVAEKPVEDSGYELIESLNDPADKDKTPGLFESLYKGGKQGVDEDLSRQAYTMWKLGQGEIPDAVPITPQKDWGWNREAIGENIGRTATGYVIPSFPAGLAGAELGGMAGAAGGPIGAGIGAAVGAGAGFGSMAYVQTLADTYQEARNKGWDHEQALDEAAKVAKIAGGGAAVMGIFGRFGSNQLAQGFYKKYLARQLPTQVGISQGENYLRNVEYKESGLDPEREPFDNMVAATVAPVVTTIGAGLISGKPKAKAGPRVEKDVTPKAAERITENKAQTSDIGMPSTPPSGGPEVPRGPGRTIGSTKRGEVPSTTEIATEGLITAEPETARPSFEIEREPHPEPRNKTEQVEDLQHNENSLRAMGRDLALEKNRLKHELKRDPENFELKRQLDHVRDTEARVDKTLKQNKKELDYLTNPKETPVLEETTKKAEPQGLVEPKKDLSIPEKASLPIKAKAPPKVVEGERVNPDSDLTHQKIFSKGGEHIPPGEVSLVKNVKDGLKSYWEDSPIETAIFDWQTPIRKVGERGTGAVREAENVPFRTARATLHMPGILKAAFKDGTPALNKHDQMVMLKPRSKGLMEILKPANTTVQMSKDFQTYLYGKRVQSNNLIAQGREKNITPAEASEAIRLEEKYPEFKTISQELNNYNKSMKEWMIDTGLENQRNVDLWADLDFVPFNRDQGVDAPYQSPKAAIVGQRSNVHYLSGGKRQFMVRDSKGNVLIRTRKMKEAKAVKKAAGKGAEIYDVGPATNDLFENLIGNTAYLLSAGVKNVAAQNSINAGLKAGSIHPVRARDVPDLKKNGERIVRARFDGKERFYSVTNRPLYDALTRMGAQSKAEIDAVENMLRKHKTLLTMGIIFEPVIASKVFLKDFVRHLILGKNSMGGVKNVIKTLGKNYPASAAHEAGVTKDPRIVQIMAGGGDSTYFGKTTPALVDEMMKEAHANNSVVIDPTNKKMVAKASSGLATGAKKVGGGIQGASRAGENAHRLTHYDAAIAAGRGEAEAVFEASDLMDYKVEGANKWINKINTLAPFIKSGLQGLHKLTREARYKKGFNRTMKSVMAVVAMSTVNALINLIPDDDEETASTGFPTLNESSKNAYMFVDLYKILGYGSSSRGRKFAKAHNIPRWFQITKPWAEGVLTATVPERIVSMLAEDASTKEELTQLALATGAQLHQNPVPPFFTEIIEQKSGQGGWDYGAQQPIVPYSKQGLEPGLQSKENSSKTAKVIGEATNYSPARIDHAVNSLLGPIVAYATTLPAVFDGEVEPKKDWWQHFPASLFLRGELQNSNKFENELYETYKEADKAYKSMKEYSQREMEGKYDEYLADNGAVAEKKNLIKDRVQRLKDYKDEISMIRKDKDYTAAQKKEQIDSVIESKNLFLLETHRAIHDLKKDAAEAKKNVSSSDSSNTKKPPPSSPPNSKKPPPPPPNLLRPNPPDTPKPPPSQSGSHRDNMKNVIAENAKKVGVDPALALAIASAENGPLDPNVVNIGAHGIYQFEKSTWKGALKNFDGAKHGITEKDILDPKANAYMGNRLIKDHHTKLTNLLKRAPTDEEQYLVHFSGWNDGRKMLQALKKNPDAPSTSVFGPQAIKDNPKRLKGKTVQQVYDGLIDRLNRAKKEMTA